MKQYCKYSMMSLYVKKHTHVYSFAIGHRLPGFCWIIQWYHCRFSFSTCRCLTASQREAHDTNVINGDDFPDGIKSIICYDMISCSSELQMIWIMTIMRPGQTFCWYSVVIGGLLLSPSGVHMSKLLLIYFYHMEQDGCYHEIKYTKGP